MKAPIVCIPTYWTRKGGAKKRDDTYFDHPTSVDGHQTLTRTLDCFKKVEGDFRVVVISSIVDYKDEKLLNAVSKRIDSLLKKYSGHFPIMHFSKSDVNSLKESIEKYESKEIISQINLTCYPAIRNFQLILTNALGSDVMIGIDDDELVNPNHVGMATEFIGKKFEGDFIYGIGGAYKDKNGNFYMGDLKKPEVNNLFFMKNYHKNNGFKELAKKPGRINKSNFMFGGNMVIHRKMFLKVAYDMAISRGENMDYLINAKMNGFDFYFDKEQYIIHLPPDAKKLSLKSWEKTGAFSSANFFKLQQDIIRFIYEHQKIVECNEHRPELNKVDVEELKPYPGNFFSEKLFPDATSAISLMFPDTAEKANLIPDTFVKNALERARKLAPQYFIFNRLWQKFMREVEKDKKFQNYLKSKWL